MNITDSKTFQSLVLFLNIRVLFACKTYLDDFNFKLWKNINGLLIRERIFINVDISIYVIKDGSSTY